MSWRAALALLLCALAGCLSPRDLPGKHEVTDSGLPARDGGATDGEAPGNDAASGDAGLPAPPVLTIVTRSLPAGEAGKGYAAVVEGSSPFGAAALSWKVSSSWLPPGLTLGAASGGDLTLSGTPQVAGAFTLSVELSDGVDSTKLELPLVVGDSTTFELPAVSLPAGEAGKPYKAVLFRHDGAGDLSWDVASGQPALPTGLSIQEDVDGVVTLAGTPEGVGFYQLHLVAHTPANESAAQHYTLHVRSERAWLAASIAPSTCLPEHARIVDVTDLAQPGPARTFLFNKFACVVSFDFAPGGGHVYFDQGGSGNAGHGLVDLRAASDSELSVFALAGVATGANKSQRWSPDGSYLAYATLAAPDFIHREVELLDLRGVKPDSVQLKGDFADSAAWAPDGSLLAQVSEDRKTLRFVHPVDHSIEEAALGEPGQTYALAWSPDSRQLFHDLSDLSGTHISRFDVATHEHVQVTPPMDGVSGFVVSHDGRSLAVTDGFHGAVHIIDMSRAFPSVRTFHAPASMQLTVLEWSEGDDFVLLYDREQGYYTVDLAHGELTRVPTEALIPGPLDRLEWLRFMPFGGSLLAGVARDMEGVPLPSRGALVQLVDGVDHDLMQVERAPAQVQYASDQIIVHEGDLIDLSRTIRVFPYAGGAVTPTVDRTRSRVYFYRSSEGSVHVVDTAQREQVVDLHGFGVTDTTPAVLSYSP